MRSKNQTRCAFTLIEIMIVVLIIGILLAIAVPNFVRAREAARQKSCIANLKALNGAHEQYLMANNLSDDTSGGGSSHWRSPSELVTDGFLKSEPKCESGGTYYEEGGAASMGRPEITRYKCSTFSGYNSTPNVPYPHTLLPPPN